MLALSAIATPNWLEGKPETVHIKNHTVKYRDSLGLYNRCGFRRFKSFYEKRCYIYARSFGEISHAAWQACIIFLAIAIVLLAIASVFGVVSLCKQLIGRKSLVNLAGTLQAFAGKSSIIYLELKFADFFWVPWLISLTRRVNEALPLDTQTRTRSALDRPRSDIDPMLI